MTTITIPQKISIQENLIAISQREYERFLNWKITKKNISSSAQRLKSLKTTKNHEKFYNKLDDDLTECLQEYKAGKAIGPFNSVNNLMGSLKA